MDVNTLLAVIQHLESRQALLLKKCRSYDDNSFEHHAYVAQLQEVINEITYLTGIVDSIREENKS